MNEWMNEAEVRGVSKQYINEESIQNTKITKNSK